MNHERLGGYQPAAFRWRETQREGVVGVFIVAHSVELVNRGSGFSLVFRAHTKVAASGEATTERRVEVRFESDMEAWQVRGITQGFEAMADQTERRAAGWRAVAGPKKEER